MLRRMDQKQFEFMLFSMRNGELVNAPENNFKVVSHQSESLTYRTVNFVRKRTTGVTLLEKTLIGIHEHFKPDLWYLNTIIMPEVATIAEKHNIPFAVHFHELQTQYNLVSESDLEMQVKKSAFTTGCSAVVCDALKMLGAPEIELQHECIDFSAAKPDAEKTKSFRQKLGIPDSHKIIVMAGQQAEIKGLDIFLRVAETMKNEPYFFLWLGSPKDSGYNLYYKKLAEQLNSTVRLMYPDPSEYYSWLNLADLFFLSSRSDPFPLVMIEAAYLGKYILGLDSGGVAEFTNEKAGSVLKTWNVPEIAEQIRLLFQNRFGEWKSEDSIARASEFDANIQVKHFEKILAKRIQNRVKS